MGFSTGSAVAFDYTLNTNNNHYDKLVLAAPLVHNVAWRWSKVGFKLYRPFIKKVPRVHRQNSHDEKFLHFNRYQDYLHSQEVPLKWVHALQVWNDRLSEARPIQKPALIIQGTKDLVVDYNYNIDFIRQKLPSTTVTYIEDAHHELFNESEPLRMSVFGIIDEYLKQ
jgi:alpha-beta hydrolase superfamily lysophospholipase